MDKSRNVIVRQLLVDASIGMLRMRDGMPHTLPTNNDLTEWLGVARSAMILIDDLVSEIEKLTDYENSNQPFRLNGNVLEAKAGPYSYVSIDSLDMVISGLIEKRDAYYLDKHQAIAALFCIVRDLQAQINQKGK